MLDTLLIINLFLLASVLVCLVNLRLRLRFFFHSLPILTDILKFPLFDKFNKDLRETFIMCEFLFLMFDSAARCLPGFFL